MFFRLFFVFLIICTVNLLDKNAYADEPQFRPELRCSEDQSLFIIQFGLFNEAGTRTAITQTIMPISSLWPSLTPAKNGACKFKNARAIQLSSRGDYKNGNFSLKIGDNNAYWNKAFFSENPETVYDSNTVIIFQNDSLTECRQVEHETHKFAVLCNSELRRLYADIDKLEREYWLRFQIAKDRGIVDSKPSPFCNSLKSLNLKYAEEYKRPPNDFEIDFLKFEEERAFRLHATFTDINDDGETDLIYRIAGSDESFYGSFLAIFLNTDEFNTAFESDYKTRYSTDKWFKSGKWKDNLFSGGMAGSNVRYVYNKPLRLNGKSYISTSEAYPKKIPSEILYEVNADGTKTPVCIYP